MVTRIVAEVGDRWDVNDAVVLVGNHDAVLDFGLLEKGYIVLVVYLAFRLSLIVTERPAWTALETLMLLETMF